MNDNVAIIFAEPLSLGLSLSVAVATEDSMRMELKRSLRIQRKAKWN